AEVGIAADDGGIGMAQEVLQILPGLSQVGCRPLELLRSALVFGYVVADAQNLYHLPPLVLHQAMGPGDPDPFPIGSYVFRYMRGAFQRILPYMPDYLIQIAALAPRREDGIGDNPTQDILLAVAEEMPAEPVDEPDSSAGVHPDDDAA